MSSRRSIIWLVFFVILAVAAHVLVSVRAGAGLVASRPGVLAPESDRATLLELSRPGVPAVAAVRSERWRLVSPFPAGVDSEVLLRALDALAFAPVSAALTEREMRRLNRTPADFGLDRPAFRLTVRSGETETSVGFGARTPAGDGVYASVSDRPGVCVVASNVFAALDLSLDDLRNPGLLAESPESVASIDVRRPGGKFVRIARRPSGEWRVQAEPEPQAVSAARVASFLKSLSEVRSKRFVWPNAGETPADAPSVSLLAGYGLDAESAVTVTLTGSSGLSRYVSFGKSADADSVYALVQNGGAIQMIPAAGRESLKREFSSLVDLRLFPCEEASLTALSITDGDTAYLLARMADGTWRLDSPVSAPADQETVHSLIRTLLTLRSTELDAKGLLVSVSTNAPPRAVARDSLLVQNRLEDLRSKEVLRLPAERIRRLTVTSAQGRREAVVWDASNRTWLLDGRDGATLNGLALAGVLQALDPLTARAVVRLRVTASETGNYGLERPGWTLAVDPLEEGAVRRNVLIGSRAPDGGFYATVGATDAIFILPEESVRALTASFVSAEKQ